MNKTIDNQQATSHQLAWLAGIWDGEGTFSIYEQSKKHLVGRITLSNTDDLMINEIIKILDLYNINGHLWKETKSRKPTHKKAYHLTINKLKDVNKATVLMLPYLISKKARAELLLRFVNSRMNYKKEVIRDDKTGQIKGMKEQGYSNEEKSLHEQIKELNKVGIK